MSAFGHIMREWRGKRRFSQLELSHVASVSARHISFLESGRALPSRDMVLRLAEALELPYPATNNALMAAGMAPHYPVLATDDSALLPYHRALDILLAHHEPFPAIVFDSRWMLQRCNSAADRLFGAMGLQPGDDLVLALTALGITDGPIVNWLDVARVLISQLRTEITRCGGDTDLERRLACLVARCREHSSGEVADEHEWPRDPVIPLRLKIGVQQLSLFTMLSEFTAAQELGLSDLRVELYFPEDEATRCWLEAAAC